MMQLNFTSYTFHYAFYNPKLLQVIVFVCFAVKSIPFSVFIKSSAFQYFKVILFKSILPFTTST